MLLVDDAEKQQVLKKLNRFFDLDSYRDFTVLSFEDFVSKYGHYGFSFRNFLQVRFENEADILKEFCNFLPQAVHYLIPITDANELFKLPSGDIEVFLNQHKISDFILADLKLTWVVVYDRHRNLTGLGAYIKKKMQRNINLRFGDTKIMFQTAPAR
ncbi:MAG: hypothetical protein ACRYFX_10680 [Janthinobacterium lividum]